MEHIKFEEMFPIKDSSDVEYHLRHFNFLEEDLQQKSWEYLYLKTEEYNVPIPNNSLLYRFININENYEDETIIKDLNSYIVTNEDNINKDSLKESKSLNSAIKNYIFSINENVINETLDLNVFTKINNEFIKIGKINSKILNLDTYYTTLKESYLNEDLRNILKENKESNILKKLYNKIKNYDYGWLNDNNVKIYNSDDMIKDQYRTLSPKEFEKYKIGVCWDYVAYEYNWLKNNLKDKNKEIKVFFSVCNNKERASHTWLALKDKNDNSYEVLEVSFRRFYHNIYKYNSLDDMLNDYISAFKEFNEASFSKITIVEFIPPTTYGMRVEEYYRYVNDNCKEIIIDRPLNTFKRNLNEDKKSTNKSTMEVIYGTARGNVSIDKDTKEFVITGLNYKKFLLRLKEMYESQGISNLFDKNYTWWSIMMWKKEKITRDSLKISSLRCPLFFALEIYKMFLDLASFYKLNYYNIIAKKIYDKTWISNYERINTGECKNIDVSMLKSFNYKLKDYQLEFVEKYNKLKFTFDLEGYILAFEQGLGKSFTAIAIAECLHKKQVVVVCPNSLKENWANEIREYYKKYNDNDSLWLDEVFVVNNGRYKFTNNTRFLIVNQEAIDKVYKYISKNKDSIIIVDESHNFRNKDSNRSEKLLKLKELLNCKDNLLMSGTPIKATPNEIIPALRMIDPYFTKELSIRYEKAFNSNKVEISRVVKERFKRTIYRKKKDQVLKLPEKIINDLFYEVSNEADFYISTINKDVAELYKVFYEEECKKINNLEKEFNELILKYSTASRKDTLEYLDYIHNGSFPEMNKSNKAISDYKMYMFQNFLNEYVYNNSKLNIKDKERIETLVKEYVHIKNVAMGKALGKILPKARANCYKRIIDDNVKDIISRIENNSKKTIIFTPFLPVIDKVCEILKTNKIGYVKIIGETNKNDRMDLINKFKNEDSIDVLVATTQTLSTGVTLVEANQMFFFGTPYRSADFDQACDRIHRIGQTSEVNIYKVLLKSSEMNITNRIDNILGWSSEMFNSIIDESSIVDIKEDFNMDFLNEEINNGNKHPLFIVLSFTFTPLGKIIKKVNHAKYSHASISLDPDLKTMYSFNGDNGVNKVGGFSIESIENYTRHSDQSYILVNLCYINDRCFKLIKSYINTYLDNQRDTKYSFKKLFYVLLNKSSENINSFSKICSEFVYDLFKTIGVEFFNKSSNLVTPNDLANIKNKKVYKLYEGLITEYNLRSIKRKLSNLNKKAELLTEKKNSILLTEDSNPMQDILITEDIPNLVKTSFNRYKRLEINYDLLQRYSNVCSSLMSVINSYNDEECKGCMFIDDNNDLKAVIIVEKKGIIKFGYEEFYKFVLTNLWIDNSILSSEIVERLINIALTSYRVNFILNDYNKVNSKVLETISNNGVYFLTSDKKYYTDMKELKESYNPKEFEIIKKDLWFEGIHDKKGSKEGVYDKLGLWNPIVRPFKDSRKYRERVECLILDGDNNVLSYINIKKCKIPGGGSMPDKTLIEQLISECNEEVRVNIKEIFYIGTYIHNFSEVHKENWKNSLPNGIQYDGALTYLFAARFDSKYNYHINYKDQDSLLMYATYNPINKFFEVCKDEWKVGVLLYLKRTTKDINKINEIGKILVTNNFNTNFVKLNLNNDEISFNIKMYHNHTFNNKMIYNSNLNEDSFVLLEEEKFTKIPISKKLSKAQRKEIEDLLYGYSNIIDKTGKNTEKFKKEFHNLSDEEFSKKMIKFLNSDEELYFQFLPNINEPNLKDIKAGADFQGLELDEYVYFRHDGDEDEPTRTPYKVPVGVQRIDRLQQTLNHKNTYTFDINQRNSKTGGLTGDSKIARITDQETYSLTSLGADKALEEFMSARADNMEKKLEMYKQISLYGYCSLKDLENIDSKGTALKTAEIYMKSAMLDMKL